MLEKDIIKNRLETGKSRPSGLRKTSFIVNSLAYRMTWPRSMLGLLSMEVVFRRILYLLQNILHVLQIHSQKQGFGLWLINLLEKYNVGL